MEMISLLEKQRIIIESLNNGKSQREITRTTGISRRTVKKYIENYNESRKLIFENMNIDNKLITDNIVDAPKYNASNRKKVKLNDKIIKRIEFFLEENVKKRAIGQGKHQLKKIDIHEALVNEGFDISYSTVSNFINKINKKGAEAYIKAEYDYGDVCEFDWGEAKLFIDGELKTFQMAVFTSAKGNYRYAKLFVKQDTLAFQESHVSFFESIGKVYRTMVYDNMKVAVKKFVGPTEKEPTEALLKMSIYYGFKFRFCNIRAGNEKGHVERSVEYVRRKSFSTKDRFQDIDEANEHLENKCKELNNRVQKLNNKQTAIEILEIEKEYMLPKMPAFDSAKIRELRVDKYSTITIDTCHYSVPDNHVGKIIVARIYSNEIICYYESIKIAEHKRKFAYNEWSIKIEHFLKTLKRKPGSLASSKALLQADPRLIKIYQDHYIKNEKEFIDLISLIDKKGIEEILEAIEILKKLSNININTEKIIAIVNRRKGDVICTGKIKYTSETVEKSIEMMNRFKNLIPTSKELFNHEVKVL